MIAIPFKVPMAGIHITDIEAAINYWRKKNPSPDGVTLPRELRALAEVYALMIFSKKMKPTNSHCHSRRQRLGKLGMPARPIHLALPFALRHKATPECKGCGRTLKKFSTGQK